MVYGETRKENTRGKKYRVFSPGTQKVPEKCTYDHVGVKNCLFGDFTERVEERISKGRRCFNALCRLGIKKSGITMKTCATQFWSIVIPVVSSGSLRGMKSRCLGSSKGKSVANVNAYQ